VLAYVYWHRPRHEESSEAASYESLLGAFHHSLACNRPAGTLASAAYRLEEIPWFQGPAYEDWYLLEDYAALGVLNEAAVGRGHRSRHDALAHRSGAGTGALYALLAGEPDARALALATLATWVEHPAAQGADQRRPELAEMLGDGMEPDSASLWRRQLVLGPAPEYCLIGREVPSGVRPSRLPAGWSASTLRRQVIAGG
jgi:hypothetical protein